jgi:hypothetical protein
MPKKFILAALMTSAMVVPASAATVTIQDFVGNVTIVTGTDGLEVVREGKKPIIVGGSGDEIFIDGGLSQKERNKVCAGVGLSWNLDFGGRESQGDTRLEDYPELLISVPNGSDLSITKSSLHLDSQVELNDADLDVGGCFDLTIAAVETLRLEKSGSGDIDIGTAGTLTIEKSGSGELEIGTTGTFDLNQSGSGDVDINRIDGPASIEKSGSGDIDIGSLNGSLRVEKSGSGDIDINGGTIPNLSIQNSGSGDVDINAAVDDAYVRASGSGDVYVKSISGALDQSVSGSSDFTRGDD